MAEGENDFTLKKRVAYYLCALPEHIDDSLLKKAIQAVNTRSNDYYDAYASVGQAPGNPPLTAAIAIVYTYLASE